MPPLPFIFFPPKEIIMSVASIVESLLKSNIDPTWENVSQNCKRLNVNLPANQASLSSVVSITRKKLGLPPRRGSGRELPIVVSAENNNQTETKNNQFHKTEEITKEECKNMEDSENLNLASYIPEVDKTFVVNDEVKVLFDQLKTLSDEGANPKALMAGPKGCGKTSIPEYFAAKNRRPFFDFYCPTYREGRDFLGTKSVVNENGFIKPKWFESLFVKAIRVPNAVINLDEINRVVPSVVNVLLPLMDHRRKVYFEELGAEIKVANGVTWFATANEGREYAGTFALDDAFRDRLSSRIEVNYLNPEEEVSLLMKRTGVDEDFATKLVQIASVSREKAASTDRRNSIGMAISTRMLIAASLGYRASGNKKASLKFNLANHFKKDGGETSDRAVILSLLIGKFGSLDS